MLRMLGAVILLVAVFLVACADDERDGVGTAEAPTVEATAASTSTPVPPIATVTSAPVPTRDPEAPEVTELVVEPGFSLEVRRESAVPDPNGHVHIHGELWNTGDVPLWGVRMDVTLYDENGVRWGEQFGYASLPVLAPGDFSPYEVLTGPDFLPEGSSWRIEVTALENPDWAPAAVTVIGGELVADPCQGCRGGQQGRSQWRGQIRNDGAETLGTLVVTVPMYDATGVMVHEPFGEVRGPIAPGEVVDAVITSFQRPEVPWETFIVKVQELIRPES